MPKNQKGFSVIEGLLLLVIAGLLGFVGWYVWNSSNKSSQNVDKAGKSSHASTKASKMHTVATPSGWTRYENKSLEISFAYPKNWTFEDKSNDSTSTKSHYVGELSSDDKATTIGITLVRKKEGRYVYTTIDEWKAYAKNSNIKYGDLAEVNSPYVAFRYVLDVSSAKSLVYRVLSSDSNAELVVLPNETNQKTIIEQIVSTLQFK